MSEEQDDAPKKGRQAKLPGFTEIEDDAVEEAAEQFDKIRDQWQKKGAEMGEAMEELEKAIAKNPKITKAAKAHPKGKVKVGAAVLTIQPKDPTTHIRVKMYEGGEAEAAE